MKKIRSISDKRLIIEASVNGKVATFLIDTGASIGLIDHEKRYDYELKVGRRYGGTIIGAGGEIKDVMHCDTFAIIDNRVVPQFLLADISGVVESIKRETGVEILGIISLPQLKLSGISIDCNDNLIILE